MRIRKSAAIISVLCLVGAASCKVKDAAEEPMGDNFDAPAEAQKRVKPLAQALEDSGGAAQEAIQGPGVMVASGDESVFITPVPDGLSLVNPLKTDDVKDRTEEFKSFFDERYRQGEYKIEVACVDEGISESILAGVQPTDLVWRWYLMAKTPQCRKSDRDPDCQIIAVSAAVVQAVDDDPAHKCPGVVNSLQYFKNDKKIYLHGLFVREQSQDLLKVEAPKVFYSEAVSDDFFPGTRQEISMPEKLLVAPETLVVSHREPTRGSILAAGEDLYLYSRTDITATWGPFLRDEETELMAATTDSSGTLFALTSMGRLVFRASGDSGWGYVHPRETFVDFDIAENGDILAILYKKSSCGLCGPLVRLRLRRFRDNQQEPVKLMGISMEIDQKIRAIAAIRDKPGPKGFDYYAINERHEVLGRKANSARWSPGRIGTSRDQMTSIAVLEDGTLWGVGKNDSRLYYFGEDPDNSNRTGWVEAKEFNKKRLVSIKTMNASFPEVWDRR